MDKRPVVGILALQGCVKPHVAHLQAAGAEVREVRRPHDFAGISALVLPGGESSTMLKLIDHFGIEETLKQAAQKIPFWGICAGAILMAKEVNSPEQRSLGVMDITVQRNAYGRQLDSFTTDIDGYTVAFIRAPLIQRCPLQSVRAEVRGNPVWVEQGMHMVSTFHPELSDPKPSPLHQELVKRCQSPFLPAST